MEISFLHAEFSQKDKSFSVFTAFPISAISQMLSAQNNPYAKVAYVGVAYSGPSHFQSLHLYTFICGFCFVLLVLFFSCGRKKHLLLSPLLNYQIGAL